MEEIKNVYNHTKEMLKRNIEAESERLDRIKSIMSPNSTISYQNVLDIEESIKKYDSRSILGKEIAALMLEAKSIKRKTKGVKYEPLLLSTQQTDTRPKSDFEVFAECIANRPKETDINLSILLRAEFGHFTPIIIRSYGDKLKVRSL